MRRTLAGPTAASPRARVVARPTVHRIGGRVDASAVGALGESGVAFLLRRAAGIAGGTRRLALPIAIRIAYLRREARTLELARDALSRAGVASANIGTRRARGRPVAIGIASKQGVSAAGE